MSCYHPLKGFIIGKTDAGKNIMKITSYEVDHLERPDESRSYMPIMEKEKVYSDVVYPSYDIPCGHCIGCRLQYSLDWAARIVCESAQFSENYFITLTYDDAHLPLSSGLVPDTGEIVTTATLVKEDWQKFMKRLRKAYDKKYPDEKLRFYMAGEYGDKNFRPHYHAIIFNLHLDDLQFYKRCGDFNYYVSPWLNELWPFGYVVVGECNWQTAAYVARYVTKKLNGKVAEKYEMLGLIPEFALMSRRPGIASAYCEEKGKHLLDYEYMIVSTPDGGRKFRPPKYFKRKFDSFFESDDMLYCVKQDEKAEASIRLMESIKQLQEDQTDLSYIELLAVSEEAQKAKIRGLERSL